MKHVFLLLLTLLCTVGCFGQRKVRMEHANTLRGTIQDGIRNDWVIGDVVFVQNETTIYCDSAIFNRAKNSIEAYGHIRITEGDSVTVTAIRLTYDGNEKIAYLRKNVIFNKLETATLYTDFLDFDRKKNKAKYFNDGKLVDSVNTLTSKKGYFDLNTNVASFKSDVVGVNKDYTMKSDTLQYNSNTKKIYFQTYTELQDTEGRKGYYQSGLYDTRKKKSDLIEGDFESSAYRIRGKRLMLDEMKQYYTAVGNVVLTAKGENMNIYGDDGFYDKKKGISKVYGHAYVARVTDEKDTIFISADTLLSIENADPRKKLLLAYHHVKIFKSDLQGKADSLVYVSRDSTIYFFKDPVLWANDNQMTADSIRILLEMKKISRIYMVSNSFVASIDSLLNYNQIKGRKMTAYFRDQFLHHVVVEGNGESIYFALQEKEEETKGKKSKFKIVSGMNKIICSNMKINFKEGKVNNISFYIKPDASFIPPHELKKDQILLKGFSWRGPERPTRDEVTHKKRRP
jgi:lipopolysaccharide export system protein LptA